MLVYDNPKVRRKGLVADIETTSQQGAYLAGVLAAQVTKTNVLGIVISADDTNWYKQSGGFVAGARTVTPDVDFRFAQIGDGAARNSDVTVDADLGGRDVTGVEIEPDH